MRARVAWRLGLALLAMVPVASCQGVRGAPELVVIVLVDALRADRLGVYGSTANLTPLLDALGREGVVFEAAQATSTWTRASIASLFTSRYPSSNRVRTFEDGLDGAYETLAEALTPAGVEGVAVTTNGNAGREFGFDQGFESFVYPPVFEGEFTAAGVTELGLQVVAQRRGVLAERPLFLYLHYIEPHDPYLPRPGFTAADSGAGRFSGSRADLQALDALPPGARQPADEQRLVRLYDGEVRYLDEHVGQLVAGLRRLGVYERTLLLVTADHGKELWDHGQRSHGLNLYQETLRVPLLMRFPGAARGVGRRVTEPISTVDVAPTILASLGLDPPPGFQGRDLSPLILGRRRAEGLPGVFSELSLGHKSLSAIRVGPNKLIRDRRPGGQVTEELFDLAADPHERADLAGREGGQRARLAELLDRWEDAAATAAGPGWRVSPEQLSPGEREQLKALGYLE